MYVFASLVIIGVLVLAWIIIKLVQKLAKLPLKVAVDKIATFLIMGLISMAFAVGTVKILINILAQAPANPSFGAAVIIITGFMFVLICGLGLTFAAVFFLVAFTLDDSWKSDQQYFDIVKKYYLKR